MAKADKVALLRRIDDAARSVGDQIVQVSAGYGEMRDGIGPDELVGLADVELMARKREKAQLGGDGAEARDGEAAGPS